MIPSLPGFGFSGPMPDAGWDTDRIARAWAELMRRLGYDRYGVQGGDIGAAVSPAVGCAAPDHVVGVHVNGSLGMPLTPMSDDELADLTDLERDRYERTQTFQREEMGYIAIQSTRPQTIGAALVDSPVGQLAWILDKAHAWTFPHDSLPDEVIGRDRLLTNVMLYWLTGTAGSAAYVGYASAGRGGPESSSGVPTGRHHVRPRRRHPPARRDRQQHHHVDRHHRTWRPLRSPRRTRHPSRQHPRLLQARAPVADPRPGFCGGLVTRTAALRVRRRR